MVSADLTTVYPRSASLLPESFACSPDVLPQILADHPEFCEAAPFLADLARVELAIHTLAQATPAMPATPAALMLHPAMELLEVDWLGLPEFIADQGRRPTRGKSHVLLLPPSETASLRIITPTSHDLLALKIVAENLDIRQTAGNAGVSIGFLENVLWEARQKGLLLSPPSGITRPEGFLAGNPAAPELLSSPAFTLQWHITQACDLHCRHCYDRSARAATTLGQGIAVLDQLYDFCCDHHVYGQVTFTGGNPFLSPHFFRLYREAIERGFLTAVLGNPVERAALEKLVAIRPPEFYQVSLEGLPAHNDHIRGRGHFQRVMDFLGLLRELDIYSMVMLTLTRANLDQVLPLAEHLKGKTDLFTFNRLAMVGEGAALASVDPADYPGFLERFNQAAAGNPALSLKDNLFNLLLHRQHKPLRGGCTGYGCGAAFNFVSLLPDGEVHACRKFPSLIGNIHTDSLSDIYHSRQASRYRQGSSGCRECTIRPSCGGCLAVSHGFGLDVLTDIDPYCFLRGVKLEPL